MFPFEDVDSFFVKVSFKPGGTELLIEEQKDHLNMKRYERELWSGISLRIGTYIV